MCEMNFHLKPSLLIALCLLLSSCDRTQFFYDRADWLIRYKIDHYLDLDAPQKRVIKQDVEQLLGWHRRTQLTCYAELIDEFESRARNATTVADLHWLEAKFSDHYYAAIDNIIEPTAVVLSELDTKQINHFEKRLAKDRSELRDELERNPDQRQKRKTKKTLTGIKKWFGSLPSTQKAWITKRSEELPDAYGPWLENRTQRDRALIKLLRSQPTPQMIGRLIMPLWIDAGASMSSETNALIEELKRQSRSMAVEFYASTSPKQKAHFWKRLQEYRNDFIQLASADGAAQCASTEGLASSR